MAFGPGPELLGGQPHGRPCLCARRPLGKSERRLGAKLDMGCRMAFMTFSFAACIEIDEGQVRLSNSAILW